VFDLHGRRRLDLVDAVLPAGRHEIRWSPGERQLSAGVYWLRLEQRAASVAKELVVVR